jgi:hypothetical protein
MDETLGIIGAGRSAGFFPIDLGDLVTGSGMQMAGGPLAGHNLVRMPAPWE